MEYNMALEVIKTLKKNTDKFYSNQKSYYEIKEKYKDYSNEFINFITIFLNHQNINFNIDIGNNFILDPRNLSFTNKDNKNNTNVDKIKYIHLQNNTSTSLSKVKLKPRIKKFLKKINFNMINVILFIKELKSIFNDIPINLIGFKKFINEYQKEYLKNNLMVNFVNKANDIKNGIIIQIINSKDSVISTNRTKFPIIIINFEKNKNKINLFKDIKNKILFQDFLKFNICDLIKKSVKIYNNLDEYDKLLIKSYYYTLHDDLKDFNYSLKKIDEINTEKKQFYQGLYKNLLKLFKQNYDTFKEVYNNLYPNIYIFPKNKDETLFLLNFFVFDINKKYVTNEKLDTFIYRNEFLFLNYLRKKNIKIVLDNSIYILNKKLINNYHKQKNSNEKIYYEFIEKNFNSFKCKNCNKKICFQQKILFIKKYKNNKISFNKNNNSNSLDTYCQSCIRYFSDDLMKIFINNKYNIYYSKIDYGKITKQMFEDREIFINF